MATHPLARHQTGLVGCRLEHTRLVSPDIAITRQLRIGDGTQSCLEPRTSNFEIAVIEQPDGPFTVGQRHHLQRQFGLFTPSAVFQTVYAHAVDIRCLAIVRRIQRYAVHTKTQVTVVILLHEGEHRAVASFHAPV